MGKLSSTELTLIERVGAEPDVAGSIQLLARNEVPNKLIARNEVGDEQRLGISLGTEIDTSTGATSYDITGIPSGVRRISINLVGVSWSGSSDVIFQIGDSGGIEVSGYLGCGWLSNTTNQNQTDGFPVAVVGAAASLIHGRIVLELENQSAFTWTATIITGFSNTGTVTVGAGSKSLSAELSQLRFTTVGGANTGDAGGLNIQFT